MDELKPCPFCGNKQIDCYADIHRDWYCECADCGIQMFGISKDEAIKNWNKRVIVDEPTDSAR
jgi:Lar family restriction alleviation protein